jgi:hypothetical protein
VGSQDSENLLQPLVRLGGENPEGIAATIYNILPSDKANQEELRESLGEAVLP